MRCARVCNFCILATLNLTSYANSSTSPTLHGAGLFGSPVTPPLQVIPMSATPQITVPPVVDVSAVQKFVTPQQNWRGSPRSSPTLAPQSVQPRPHISYPQQGNAYAGTVSPSGTQPAGSPQLAIPHGQVTPAVPAMEPLSSTGRAIGVYRPSPPQASSVTPLVTSTQPAPSVSATPGISPSMPQDESAPSHPGDLPQLQRTSPWLFSATRDKLLGAIHFMKSTEEQVSYPYGYRADGGAPESPTNVRSSPRNYNSLAEMIGFPAPSLAAGVGNWRGEIAAGNYNQPNHLQTHSYTSRDVGAHSSAFENSGHKGKPVHHHDGAAPHTETLISDTALDTSEAFYSHTIPAAPLPLSVELLQRQEPLQQVQQRHSQGPQQQLQQNSRDHKVLPSEEQEAIHSEAERAHGKFGQRQQETEDIQPAQQQTEATQRRRGPQPQLKAELQSQLLSQRYRLGGQQQATTHVALPLAEIPTYTSVHSMPVGRIHRPGLEPYAQFNVYVSENGKAVSNGIRMGRGSLPHLIAIHQTPQAATARKSDTSYVESLVRQAPMSMETSVPQVVQLSEAETAGEKHFHQGNSTPGNLIPQRYQTELREKESVLTDGGTVVDAYYKPQKHQENTPEVATEFSASDVRKVEEQGAHAENSVLTEENFMSKKRQAGTSDEDAPTPTPVEESRSRDRFTVETSEGETRLQEGREDGKRARDASEENLLEPPLTPTEVSTRADIADQPESGKVEATSTFLHGLTSESVDFQGQAQQEAYVSQGESGEPDTAPVAPTSVTNNLGDPLSTTGGDKVDTQVEERPANTSSSATMHTRLPTPDVDAKQETTPLSAQNAVSGTAASQVMTASLASPPGLKNGEADVAPALTASAETVMQVAPPQPVQFGIQPAGIASASPTNSVEVGSSNYSPPTRSTGMLRQGTPGVALLVTSPPLSVSLVPEKTMPPSIIPTGRVQQRPADALFVPPFLEKEVKRGRPDTVSPATAPNMALHTGVSVAASPELGQRDSAYISPSLPLTAAPLFSSTNFNIKAIPLNSPGALLPPVTTPAMLQPLPVNTKRPSTGDPAFLASAVDKSHTPYLSSTSYAAPQSWHTPFPAPSAHFLAASRPTYISPGMNTDTRSTSLPAPVYIGQSIRQDTRTSVPPVYPLGARLYEQMIPRAEFFLASSTYAEEYLDLFAALYCLFHKWPCNNMQEFAEETRKRQEEMNSSGGGGKMVA